MKKNIKRIISMLLCVVLIASCFINAPATHAEAAGPEIVWAATSAMEFIAFVFGLLGISFATKGAMVQASNQYLSENPQINQGLNDLIGSAKATVNGTMTLTIGAEIFLYMRNVVIPSVSSYFSRSSTSISVPITEYFNINNTHVLQDITSYTSKELYDFAQFDYALYTYDPDTNPTGKYLEYTIGTNKYEFYIRKNTYSSEYQLKGGINGSMGYGFTKIDGSYTQASITFPALSTNQDFKFGFYRSYTGSSYYQILPYIVASYKNSLGVLTYESVKLFSINGSMTMTVNTIDTTYDKEKVGYGYDIDYSLQELLTALQQKIDTLTDAISLPWDGPAEDVEEGKEEAGEDDPEDGVPYVPDWPLWWQALGIKDLISTLTQSNAKTESDFDTENTQLPVDIKDKFPFCVPFDLIALVTALNAPAQVPSVTIPLKFSAMNYESSITINLSQFEGVATAVRWGMTLLFLFGLTVLTRKLIKG